MTTRSRRRRRQAPYERPEQQSRPINATLTYRYGSSYEHVCEHVYINGIVGGEEINVTFRVPTIAEVHKHFNNPRKKGQTCVHGAYLLFRTFFSLRMSEHATVKKQRGQISKISKEIWDKAGEDVRDRFAKLAKETHDKFKREVPLIWVNETSPTQDNSKQVDHSDNNEANVARDIVVPPTVATETTLTDSVFVPVNEPTNNISALHWSQYELEQMTAFQNLCLVYTLQHDVHEQSVAAPTVLNTPAGYNYTYDNTIVDYSDPLPAESFSTTGEYGIMDNYFEGIVDLNEYNEYNEHSRHRGNF